jgi:Spy/CpxP family protein refolding chaperone
MDFFSKQRILGGMFVVLVVLNIVLLGTVWKQFFQKTPETTYDAQLFMQQELSLTEVQMAQLEALRSPHLAQTKQVLDKIHDLKKEITAELFAASPDTAHVEELAKEIGYKYAELERLHYQFFLGLREMFEPEQQEQLHALMEEILRQVQPPPLPQGGAPQPVSLQPPPGGLSQPGRPSQNGRPPRPPEEAKQACQGKQAGVSCQFRDPRGPTVTGTCQMREQLVCVPN